MSNFVDYAGPMTEMVLLGNVAMRVGQPIDWDADNLRVTNNAAAAQYIRHEYRQGWEITAEPEPRIVQAQFAQPQQNGTYIPEQRPARFPLLRRIFGRR